MFTDRLVNIILHQTYADLIVNSTCVMGGLVFGAGLFMVAFPALARFINGPIQGEDHMSANAVVLFIGLPATSIMFAIVTGTWWAMRLRVKA